MWRIRKCIDIHQPIDIVFNYLIQWHQITEWDTSVLKARKRTVGKPAVGSTFDLTLLFGWNRMPMTYTITSMAPPHAIELTGEAASFQAVDRIQLEKIGAGTRLTYIAEVTFDRPLGSSIDRLAKWVFIVNARQAIKRLHMVLSGSPRKLYLTAMTRMADQALLPGLIGFTRWGYFLARRRRPVATALYGGKTVVLTGGTSGIGKATAHALVTKGVHLVVVGRDAAKLQQLSRELGAVQSGGRIDTERADLSLMSEVSALAGRLNQRYGRIDVLINNAGALFNRYQKTAEGLERTLATDLLSPYLLTRLLLPALQAATSGRVINVASGGMYTQGIHIDALEPDRSAYDGPTAYARAKRGLVLLTGWWARQWAPMGISVHAMHPGWVDTPGLQQSLPAFHARLSSWLRTPAQGADTIVWLAAAPDAARASGQFWLDRKIRATQVFPHTRGAFSDGSALVNALDKLAKKVSIR